VRYALHSPANQVGGHIELCVIRGYRFSEVCVMRGSTVGSSTVPQSHFPFLDQFINPKQMETA
jgi:hypothetical protein